MIKQPGTKLCIMALLTLMFIVPLFSLQAAESVEQTVDPPDLVPNADNRVEVPDLYSMKKQEALSLLEQTGLIPLVKKKTSMNFDLTGMDCRILSQTPLPGQQVMRGTQITIYIYVPVGSCEGRSGTEPLRDRAAPMNRFQ